MNKILSIILVGCFIFTPFAHAKTSHQSVNASRVQTINNHIEVQVYKYKKTKHYTAVEIGFTNHANNYVGFRPQEIYLDDEKTYSKTLLSMNQIRTIEQRKPGMSLFPTAIAVGLGIAALGTSRASRDVSFGLAMGALGAGGIALLTKGLEERAKQNKLIAIENNTLSDIKRLPPGMTLGGLLYFGPTKKPKSITLIVKNNKGQLEKRVFYLKGL